MLERAGVELVVKTLEPDPKRIGASIAILSAAERARASRLARDRDRHRYVLARAGLRRLLGARLNARPEAVQLAAGRHGKPALGAEHAASGLRFNLSRCADLAVYAFSWEGEVGVDVEAVRTIEGADDIAATVFSPRESGAYRALGRDERARAFFDCWTRKEAFVKALGRGLTYSLRRFDVSLAPGEPARILRVDDTPGEECGWRLHEFAPRAGWVGALVTQNARTTDHGIRVQ